MTIESFSDQGDLPQTQIFQPPFGISNLYPWQRVAQGLFVCFVFFLMLGVFTPGFLGGGNYPRILGGNNLPLIYAPAFLCFEIEKNQSCLG